MKRFISIIAVSAVLATVTLALNSCSNPKYAETGLEFLESAFGNSDYTAKSLMAGDESDKDELLDYVKEIKDELPGRVSDFKFRAGNTFEIWGEEIAEGYYSYGSNTQYIIMLDFSIGRGNKWEIEDLSIYEVDDLIHSYTCEKEELTSAINEGDKDKIKSAKEYVRKEEKVVKAFKDFMSKSQMEEYNSIKSGK